MSGANAGRAVFEAVGKFGGLISEGKRAEDALKRTRAAGEGVGDAIPPSGGKVSTGLQNIGKRAGELGDKMERTGNRITLSLTAPIALIGGTAVKSFADFEKSLVHAQQKAGANEEQMKRMKDLALEMGAATAFSAGEAAASLDNLAALGFDAEGAIAALPGVLLAAQASGEDLALTTETVAKAMNAFNISAEDTPHVADVFAQAANSTALGMQDIADGIANAGEVGPRFGQNMEGVIAMLGRLVDKGVPAASAGVAIRSALVNLAAPATKASNLIKGLGIETRDAQGNMLQLPDLVKNVKTALDKGNPAFDQYRTVLGKSGDDLNEWAVQNGLTTAQAAEMQTALEKGAPAFQDYALKTVFGVEGAKAFALAMADGKPLILDTQRDVEKLDQLQAGLAETMGKKQAKAWIDARTEQGKFVADGPDALRAIEGMGKASEGLSEKVSEAFQETTAQRIDNMIGSLETLGITLVDRVAPSVITVLDGITSLVNKIGEFTNQHDWAGPLIVGAAVFLAALGPVLSILGKITKLVGGVARVGGKLSSIGRGGKTPNAPPASGGALGSAAKAVQVFWTKALPVYMAKAGAVAAGGAAGGPAVAGAPRGGAPTPAGGRRGPGRVRQAVSRTGRGAKGVGKHAAGGGAGGLAIGLMSGQSGGELAKTVGLFAGIELAMVGVTKAMGKIGPAAAKGIKAFGSLALAGLKAAGQAAVAAARIVASWVIMGAKATFEAARMAAAWLLGVVTSAGRAVLSMAISVAAVVGGWILMGAQAMLQAARMAAAWLIAMGPIGLVIAAVIGLAVIIYKNWDKIVGFIKQAWERIKSAVSSAVSFVVNFVKKHWKTLLAIIAGPLGLIIVLIVKNWDRIKAIFNAGAAVIKAIWTTAWNKIKEIVGGAINWVREKIAAGIQKVKNIWAGIKSLGGVAKNAFETVKSAIGDAIDWVLDKIQGVIDKINGVFAKIGELKGKATGLLGDVGGAIKGGGIPFVPGFKTGGQVPGSQRGDVYPARLEPGEFVVRRAAVKRPGILNVLRGLNRAGGGSSTDMFESGIGNKLATNAMRAGVFGGSGFSSVHAPPTRGSGLTAESAGSSTDNRKVEVTVNNPLPERASQSVRTTLRDRLEDAGWGL